MQTAVHRSGPLETNAKLQLTVSRTPLRLNGNLIFAFVIALFALWLASNDRFDRVVPVAFSTCALVGLFLKLVLGACMRFSNLTLPAVFFWAYFVLMSLPSIYVYLEMDHWIRNTYFLAIQSVLATFPLGVLVANICFKNPTARVRRYAQSPLQATAGDIRFSRVVNVLFLAALAVTAFYVAVSQFIPILKLVLDYSSRIDDVSLRFTITELPRAALYCFALSRSLILPLCVLYLYYMSKVRGLRWKRDYLLTFAAAVVIACLSLERAPLMGLCGMLVCGIAVAYMRRPLAAGAMRSYACILGIAILLSGFISAIQYDSEVDVADFRDGIEHFVVNRITLASARTASMAFETFPTSDHLLHGRYIRMFALITGGEYFESRYAPQLVILPVTFVGDLWRNWGWPAVIGGGVAFGFVFQCIQLVLFRRKTVVSAVFQAILMLICIWLIPANTFGIVTTSLLACSTIGGYMAISYSLGKSRRR